MNQPKQSITPTALEIAEGIAEWAREDAGSELRREYGLEPTMEELSMAIAAHVRRDSSKIAARIISVAKKCRRGAQRGLSAD